MLELGRAQIKTKDKESMIIHNRIVDQSTSRGSANSNTRGSDPCSHLISILEITAICHKACLVGLL